MWFERHHPEPTPCRTVTMAHASIQGNRSQRSETRVWARDIIGKLSAIELPPLWGENTEIHLLRKRLLSLQAREVRTILWIHNSVNPDGEVLAAWCFRPQISRLLASEEVPLGFAIRVEDCIGLLAARVEWTHKKCGYPRMVDKWAGAAALVAAEKEPNSGIHERLLLACRVTMGALRATVMLHCVGPAVPRQLDFPLHRLHRVQCLWLTRMMQIRNRISESEVWSKFSQTIESSEAHLGAQETSQDERSETCEMITGDWRPEINLEREKTIHAWYMMISRLCEVIHILRLLTTKFIIRKLELSASMQLRCTGGMAPQSTIQSTM